MHLFEDSIFERLLDALKVGDRVVVTSHDFYQIQSHTGRVGFAYQLLEEENLLPTFDIPKGKCSKIASDLRNEGNKEFQRKRDLTALQLYNRSLCAAPINSKEYALAVANRSAVYWSLGFFDACLNDISEALSSGYPDALRFKLLERRVKCFLQLGKEADANMALEELRTILQKMPEGARLQPEATLKSIIEDFECNKDNYLKGSKYMLNRMGCTQRPSVSGSQNTEIDCASSYIALEYSEDKGRYLSATTDINPGDVLIVEKPYASVLLPEAAASHCYYCLMRCLSPVPCQNCSEVLFCSEKCRSDCWDLVHCVDCSLLPIISKNVGKMGLLALRILILSSKRGTELKNLYDKVVNLETKNLRTQGFNAEGKYLSSDYLPIHYLVDHTESRPNADLFWRSVTAACLLHCLKEFTHFFPEGVDDNIFYFCGGLLLQHLQSLPCNAHEVSEMIINKNVTFESLEIGAAAYATLSLLNHSCDPNVVRHSYGDWAVLRAIRPIKMGEEILDNYGYHHALHSVEERRSLLSQQYFFHCMCEACLKSWPLYKDQPSENPLYKCLQCGAPLKKDENSADPQLCSCGFVNDLVKIEEDINRSSKLFRKVVCDVQAGCYLAKFPDGLFEPLTVLSKHIQRPWREFSEYQESIKQCLSLHANHIIL